MIHPIKDPFLFKDTFPKSGDYWDLFQTTGWNDEYNFTKEDLEIAIKNSRHSISIYDNDTLIGFGRIIADGIHHAFMVDLMIHPDHQGKGFGTQLLDKLVTKCKEKKY